MPDPITRDERLARLLTDLTDRRRQGERPDLADALRQHPDLADELPGLWATVEFAEALGRPGLPSRSTVGFPGSPPAPAPANGPLPRAFGDYELLEEIGRGGMGVVYRARQHHPERIVALKMTLRGELATPEERARFKAEAEAAGKLNHPNIVPVYQTGECDGQAYLSMQYVAGPTLARRVADGPLPPREAARLVAVIARAVHHAHQSGVVHRDLKPSNVILDRDGQPRVTDFGLARCLEGGDSLTRTGAIVGSPSHMAPEQAAGGRGSVASDVYSLGAILYHLLTGRPPFQAATVLDTLLLVREQEPVQPRRLNPKVDRDLEWICLKCLEKRPELRYRTAEELAGHLEAFLGGETPEVWPSSMAYFVSRMLRETHHAAVLENWGLLWMWHSLMVLIQCGLTALLAWYAVTTPLPYLFLWGVGLWIWAGIFWWLRRRAGPVLFVERQIAHVWGAAVIASVSLFFVEMILGLRVLTLSPILAVFAGMIFLVKGGVLSGSFYVQAVVCYLTAGAMAVLQHRFGPEAGSALSVALFGLVTAACFFVPGLKYHRQRLQATAAAGPKQ
ncbi:MAG TPA: protein kinase [Gemmataceae bacterium]|nr:protein kinase [Gemmataceae bacterium]